MRRRSTKIKRAAIVAAFGLMLPVAGGLALAHNDPDGPSQSSMMDAGGMGSMMSGNTMGQFDEDESFDRQFIDQMITHHEGAILSSEHMISDSENPELRRLAKNIEESQSTQIHRMRDMRERWHPEAEQISGMMNRDHMNAMMDGGGMQQMMDGEDTDTMFLRMMIPHHQRAVEMSERALEEAEHPELKKLAREIIADQSAEIDLMRGYLEKMETTPEGKMADE